MEKTNTKWVGKKFQATLAPITSLFSGGEDISNIAEIVNK